MVFVRSTVWASKLLQPCRWWWYIAWRGMIYTIWVPQIKILNHKSVSALLNSSSFSSVVKAIQFGKALILLPWVYDQGIIAKHLRRRNWVFRFREMSQTVGLEFFFFVVFLQNVWLVEYQFFFSAQDRTWYLSVLQKKGPGLRC